MKKFILFSFLVLAFAASMVPVQAQERTVLLNAGKELDLNVSKWYAYNGNIYDRLIPVTRDTIDYIIQVKNQNSGPLHFYAAITLDTIAGADTTVAITVQQKKFAGESYSDIIASANTSAVSSELIVAKTTLGVTGYAIGTLVSATTTYVNNTVLYPRYIKFRLIIKGNDHTGIGIKVKRIEIQFYN